MRNMRSRKYFLGMSLFGLLLSLSASSSAMSWTASEGLKLRTLSAVSEAARGQVRMELKAAPGEEARRQIMEIYIEFCVCLPMNPREKMITPNVPRNSKIKSPS